MQNTFINKKRKQQDQFNIDDNKKIKQLDNSSKITLQNNIMLLLSDDRFSYISSNARRMIQHSSDVSFLGFAYDLLITLNNNKTISKTMIKVIVDGIFLTI